MKELLAAGLRLVIPEHGQELQGYQPPDCTAKPHISDGGKDIVQADIRYKCLGLTVQSRRWSS
jgi:hypothetical protein